MDALEKNLIANNITLAFELSKSELLEKFKHCINSITNDEVGFKLFEHQIYFLYLGEKVVCYSEYRY